MNKKEEKKQQKKKKMTGFALNPDNINRTGRPKKGESITEILKEYMSEPDAKDKSRKEVLVEKLYKLAKNDLTALKYLIDRVDGKPVEKHEVESESDVNLNINIKGE